jgi:hypothetical protein
MGPDVRDRTVAGSNRRREPAAQTRTPGVAERVAISGWHTVAEVVLESVLTCPQCGHASRERMPTDVCQFFYECAHCHSLLRPQSGHCCVFCSFGSVRCPSMQEGGGCCDD